MEFHTASDVVLPDDALGVFADALRTAIAARYPDAAKPLVFFEAPRIASFGDAATNVAFTLAKAVRAKPHDIAATLINDARERAPHLASLFTSIEPAAGFINLRLAPSCWHAALARILREGERFGRLPRNGALQNAARPKNGKCISLEFGSANPTGPLVVVQGRTLSIGDVLAKALRFCGYDVFTEWLINDTGGQIDTLGRSLYARYRQIFDPAYPFPEDGYPGDYLLPIAQHIAVANGKRWIDAPESEWLPHFSTTGCGELVAEQRETVRRFGVEYDLWQSDKELHDTGRVQTGIKRLSDLGLTYEQDGALFFKATQFGDDKDRVIVRSDGRPTYYGTDIAYHYDKLQRADRVIDILGPDHHGYIGRLKGIAAALGYEGKLDVLMAQQITLMRGTEQVSMSKRAGHIVTLDEILDEVGNDAARFFFVMLATDSPLTFDLQLAKEKTLDNPVYYVQYGYTRIAGVLRKAESSDVLGIEKAFLAQAESSNATTGPNSAGARAPEYFALLTHPTELALVRRIYDFPNIVQGVAEYEAPHRLARYARDIASDFHSFYTECRILEDDRELRLARLTLCIATKTVLAQVLALLGVSSPEVM